MDQNTRFQHIMLMGLWVLIRKAFGGHPIISARSFRAEAIRFGDDFGNQKEEAKEYRRQETYPEI